RDRGRKRFDLRGGSRRVIRRIRIGRGAADARGHRKQSSATRRQQIWPAIVIEIPNNESGWTNRTASQLLKFCEGDVCRTRRSGIVEDVDRAAAADYQVGFTVLI